MDYIPAEGSALPVPHSKHRINHPHTHPVEINPWEYGLQSIPTASVGGLHLPFQVIWSHRVWGQVPMSQVSRLRRRG